MFVARTEELGKLKDAMARSGCASLVYGKRRVGKTRLIMEAMKTQESTVIYYECKKGTIRENVNAFAKVLSSVGVLPFSTSFEDFPDVFAYLNTLQRRFVVVIDEYPYLSALTDAETNDSVFQNIIDNCLFNIHLVLSGSQISVMKNLLKKGNALFGRFCLILHLKELNYREAAAFYPSKTPYEKIAFYSVFGGSPFVLQELKDDETLEQNIVHTILSESSPVYLYASNLLLTDYSNAVNAERILAALGNGKKKYTELENRLNAKSTGSLAKQLNTFIASELICQTAPINKLNDAKKKSYEINDNLIRFYYAYIYPNRSAFQMIGPQVFYNQFVSPTLLKEFVPHRFEELCRIFFSLTAREGGLPGITNIGLYYYDDPSRRRNGEFDVALEFGDQYQIYEAKYYANPMTMDEVHREAGQIRAINDLKISGIGFIAVNGYQGKEEGYMYYEGQDLY